MKKIRNFLRSMRFGILLLLLIALCSVAGSVIPQGKEVAYYAQNYTRAHPAILFLQLDNIFESWYFIVLLALLCVNLTLCSVVRGIALMRDQRFVSRAALLPDAVRLTPAGVEKLRAHLKDGLRCRETVSGDATVYSKRLYGRYGTFITHLAILLTVIIGAGALYLPTVTDETCLPGEQITMRDGTAIAVDSFRIENEAGDLDYSSEITVTLPDGRKSESTRIRVNYPMHFGPYKIYQQTYGTAGSVSVKNLATGGSEVVPLTESVFLTLDGQSGLWFDVLYPGYTQDEDGNITLINNMVGSYEDPVYQIQLAENGEYISALAFPGDAFEVGGLEFRFNDPIDYPGLRIKHTPTVVNILLLLAFLLMTAGLFITFFLQPVLVKVDAEGYAVGGPKPEGTRLALEALLESEEALPSQKEETT